MKKDKIFKLILGILAVFCTRLGTGVECIEVRNGDVVTFQITIPGITKSSNALENVYHPETNVLFIIEIKSSAIERVTQPSESIYKDRISGLKHDANTITFQFRVTKRDAGNYSCKVHTSCLQKLIIIDEPSKPVVENLSSIVAYSSVEFNCSTNSTTLPLDHGLTMKYIWRNNGQTILDGSNSSVTLMVTRKMKADKLTCQAYEYSDLKSNRSDPLILDPDFEPEEIQIVPSSIIQQRVGSSLTVTCTVECKPECIVSWTGKKSVENNELTFSKLTRLDDGDYTCHAKNEHGSSNEDLTIHVHYKPILVSKKLGDTNFAELRIKEYSSLNITLEIDSNPEPDVKWIQNGKILQGNGTTMLLSGPEVHSQANINKYLYNSVYKLIQAQCKDMANYSAKISNQYGEISSSSFHIQVLCKPRIDDSEYFKTEFAPELGDTVVIIMRVVAFPLPVISNIYHDDGSVISISTFNQTHTTPSDYLTVFTLTKSVQTLKDFGCYHVELFNSEEKVNITVHFKDKGKPSTPEDLSVTEIKALSVTLQWTSTFNGGDKQTFSVQYKHLYGNWTFFNQTYHDPGEGFTVKAEIKGLRDLTAYMFRVQAKNKFGTSDFTPSLPVTTIELKKIPLENAGMSTADVGMWVGIGVALLVLIIVVIIAIFFVRRKYQAKKKDNFFKEIRDAGDPMMPGQFLELSNKENHHYEEITEHRLSRAGSPSTNSNGTSTHGRSPAPTSAPQKPPRTFEEPSAKKPEPIWKPVEKKAPKVNENTLHLAVARKSLKPVTNKGQL